MRIPHFQDKTFNAFSLAVIGAAIVLMVAGVAYYLQQERQKEAIDRQTARTNQLILEVKDLSEQNKTLNEQNRNYTYCNAMLFAKYTQNQQPIVIKDLNNCITTSFSGQTEPSEPTNTKEVTTSGDVTATDTPAKDSSKPSQPQSPQPANSQPAIYVPGLVKVGCNNVLALITACK